MQGLGAGGSSLESDGSGPPPEFGFEWGQGEHGTTPACHHKVFVLADDERLSAVKVVQCPRCVHTIQFVAQRADGSSRSSAVYGTPHDAKDIGSSTLSVRAQSANVQLACGLIDSGSNHSNQYGLSRILGIAYLSSDAATSAFDDLFAEVTSTRLRYKACAAGALDGLLVQMRTAPPPVGCAAGMVRVAGRSKRLRFDGTETDSFALSLESPCNLAADLMADNVKTKLSNRPEVEYDGGLFLKTGDYQEMTDNVVLVLRSNFTVMVRHQNGGKYLCADGGGQQVSNRLVWKKPAAGLDGCFFTLVPQPDDTYGLLLSKTGTVVTAVQQNGPGAKQASLVMQAPQCAASGSREKVSVPFTAVDECENDSGNQLAKLDRLDVPQASVPLTHQFTQAAESIEEAADGLVQQLHAAGLGPSRTSVTSLVIAKASQLEIPPGSQTAAPLPRIDPVDMSSDYGRRKVLSMKPWFHWLFLLLANPAIKQPFVPAQPQMTQSFWLQAREPTDL